MDAMPTVKEIDPKTAKAWLDSGEATLIDVREIPESQKARIPGAALVPLSAFDPSKIPQQPGLKVVVHCAVGQRSAAAIEYLAKNGYKDLYNLSGGIQAWVAAGYPLESG